MENNLEQYHILLIEDEEMIARYIEDVIHIVLKGACRLTWAQNLQKGLRILAEGGIDLVFLDLNLPDSQGEKTLETFIASAPEPALVLLTGVDDIGLATRAIQLGAQDYLVKGRFESDSLPRVIRYSIERRKILAKLQFQNEKLLQLRHDLELACRNLKESQFQILQQEKMASIGQLAAGVAHEINNPVGFIMSNLNTLGKYVERLHSFLSLQSGALDAHGPESCLQELALKRKELKVDFLLDDARNLIHESLDGVERVRGIVQDLKNYSRQDQAQRNQINLNELLDSTINIIWNELKYKVTLEKNYGELPLLTCYHQQVSQVFMNLLMNASQAIEKQGKISIKTWTADESILVSVCDTGCGIPKESLGHIFDPFFTTKEVGKGTGLGLSITYDIVVKKHGGNILVESDPGKGSVFTVRFPLVEARELLQK